ncbi:probable polygalacturonase At1g80170 [Malania oleifera]|uniref:probable polygalacturonase At1g80170 n=1 Tax=Malania oleifera TaxID=397392 RepID=UPI0025ADAE12|nr:probable polygalacturonase At1g80170 [Malania oleifera]
MSRSLFFFELALISLLFSLSKSRYFITDGEAPIGSDDVFDVTAYGATGDGITDDTQVQQNSMLDLVPSVAFRNAWKDTCESMGSPTMLIPSELTFLLYPVIFNGKKCNSDHITVLIDGNLIAPSDPSEWECTPEKCSHWIEFSHVNGLYVQGSGAIRGQGAPWWHLPCNKQHNCSKKPTAFVISRSDNVHLSQLTFEDSPQMHIAIESSIWIFISYLSIIAPADSPNTDGIHIQQSQNVYIQQSSIGTGDDCISIGNGSAYININQILCGPGHGISIGSLGIKKSYETVEFVHVRDVLFFKTTNGVRIKTWQGGSGFARHMYFERIITQGAALPIVIDQFYCAHSHCQNETSAVRISDITYNKIMGTSEEPMAVKLACSESVPCTNILMKDVYIASTDDGRETSSYCLNVQGRQTGKSLPVVPCLMQS